MADKDIEYNSMADKLIHPGSGKGRSKKESEQNTNRFDPCGDTRKLTQEFKNSEKNRQMRENKDSKGKKDAK